MFLVKMRRLVVLLLLATLSSSGIALQCYVCNNCEKVSSSLLKTCGNETSAGFSVIETEDIDRADADEYECVSLTLVGSANNRTISRGCIGAGAENQACLLAASVVKQMKSVTLHICHDNGCNSSSMAFLSMAALACAVMNFLKGF